MGQNTCKRNRCKRVIFSNDADLENVETPLQLLFDKFKQRFHKWLQLDSNQNHLVCKRTLNHFWPNGWVFVYEISGSGFDSSCSHLNFRFCACFEQGVPWYSGNYSVDSLWNAYVIWQEHTVKDFITPLL